MSDKLNLPEYPWTICIAKARECPECGSPKTYWHGKLYCQSCQREFKMTRQEAYGDRMCYKCGHAAHPDNPKCERCVRSVTYWKIKAEITHDKSWIPEMKCA